MRAISRPTALGLLVASVGLLALRVASRSEEHLITGVDASMMGSMSSTEMGTYMDLFNRHGELRRTVELVPGGVRTLTQTDDSDHLRQLQAHVVSMYSHLERGTEVRCMSPSLPILFGNARRYRRVLEFRADGVAVIETTKEADLVRTIRAHAAEVTGFLQDGLPAMMRGDDDTTPHVGQLSRAHLCPRSR